MTITRRNFFKKTTLGALGSPFIFKLGDKINQETNGVTYDQLDKVLSLPVVKTQFFSDPVIIEDVSLLSYGNSMLCRVTSSDGAEGICVSNDLYIQELAPIFLKRIKPVFVGKNAVQLEELMLEAFFQSYKLQGLALWIPLATIEMAILDLLGKISDKSMGE